MEKINFVPCYKRRQCNLIETDPDFNKGHGERFYNAVERAIQRGDFRWASKAIEMVCLIAYTGEQEESVFCEDCEYRSKKDRAKCQDCYGNGQI